MISPDESPSETSLRRPPGDLGHWLQQGVRTALLRKVDWTGLRASPAIAIRLSVLSILFNVLYYRLAIVGPATFYWRALFSGWSYVVALALACWVLALYLREDDAPSSPRPGALLCLFIAQGLAIAIPCAVASLAWVRFPQVVQTQVGWVLAWAVWIGALGWMVVAQLGVALRGLAPGRAPRAVAIVVVLLALAVRIADPGRPAWYARSPASARNAEPAELQLTQAVLEEQPRLLQAQLAAVKGGPSSGIRVYAITFAPYGDDVFRHESEVVADVMAQRFDTGSRTIQLVNHPATAGSLPWATPLNLQRAIQRVAAVMDRDRDVLFIHLTSHGGRDAHLAASLWPLTLDELTPQVLRGWLDEARIRYRIVSISACYSGSWIEPLADPGTLVMTAADADHTSFGCGSRSELTFFGRAMYDEQMRMTWSFEAAHAAARSVIARREVEAGKTDGYSNPQIRVGAGIREQLDQLESQRRAEGDAKSTSAAR
jgi:hypothetical protein